MAEQFKFHKLYKDTVTFKEGSTEIDITLAYRTSLFADEFFTRDELLEISSTALVIRTV